MTFNRPRRSFRRNAWIHRHTRAGEPILDEQLADGSWLISKGTLEVAVVGNKQIALELCDEIARTTPPITQREKSKS